MSTTGEDPLFDGDGTYAPVPQDSFADPLSGLVTTGGAEQSVPEDYARLRIADPVQPDLDTVQRMVNAAMLAESGDRWRPEQPDAITGQPTSSPAVPGPPPLGMLPQQRTWPVRPPQLPRFARRTKALPAPADFEEAESEEGELKRSLRSFRAPKPSSSSAGVILAVVLMIVFAILAIQLVVSLFSGIAAIFS